MDSKISSIAAAVLSASIGLAPLCGCGKAAPPPPVDDTVSSGNGESPFRPGPAAEPAQKQGMGAGSKVVMLAGAAALYYLYKHHQTAAAQGEAGQYYLSKKARVYYRDSEHRAHWVTAPPDGLRVPETEAQDYQQFQGYDGRSSGRDLAGLASDE
jgi:hypothetical protein